MKVELTFTEPLLGTLAGDPKVATEFILSKHPDGIPQPDETESLEETTEKASTLFSRNSDGQPLLWDYQIKGFLKSACLAMLESGTMTEKELKPVKLGRWSYKRTIDLVVFPSPRRLILELPDGVSPDNLDFLERPLRKDGFKGGNVCLARSETCPVGTKLQCEITTLNPKLTDYIKRWLDYGALSGLGQWRNSGMGRFDWTEIE